MSLSVDKILIPVSVGDERGFSLGRHAVRSVSDLVGDRKSTIILMFKTGTIDDAELPPPEEGSSVGVYRTELGNLKKAFAVVGERLESLVETAKANGLDCEAEIVANDEKTPDAICARASDLDCGMIVMSSHGHTGLKKLVLGSVTGSVVTNASVPVLVLRGESVETE